MVVALLKALLRRQQSCSHCVVRSVPNGILPCGSWSGTTTIATRTIYASTVARVDVAVPLLRIARKPPSIGVPRIASPFVTAPRWYPNACSTTIRSCSNNEVGDGYTHLLTRATARQLKGDVSEALALTHEAISVLQSKLEQSSSTSNSNSNNRWQQLQEDTADAFVFLGKLHNLQNAYDRAIESFSKALERYREIEPGIDSKQQQLQLQRKELTALSHLASAKSRSHNHQTIDPKEIHDQFETALSGLEDLCGWEDGMTNHTAHEWSLFCRSQGEHRKALSILTTAKDQLAQVFGASDPRVLMLNGELAELWQLVPNDDTDDTDTAAPSSGASSSPSTSEDKAMALLEEALDELPPNSPEARRIFMQLEEWKEAKENDGGANNNNNNNNNNTKTVEGIAMTFTKGSRGR